MPSESVPTRLEELFANGIQVELVNITNGYILLDNSETIPIVKMFDDQGLETEDPDDDIVALVAGSDEMGWLTIHLVEEDGNTSLH